jgi:hypothetical protein
MTKYFKFRAEVKDNRIYDISAHNLASESLERHDLDDGSTIVRVEGTSAQINEWKAEQIVELTEAIGGDLTHSEQLRGYKERLKAKAGIKASEAINAAYPLYKQININALQGYDEAARSAMWEFINAERSLCNEREAAINAATALAELTAIEGGI